MKHAIATILILLHFFQPPMSISGENYLAPRSAAALPLFPPEVHLKALQRIYCYPQWHSKQLRGEPLSPKEAALARRFSDLVAKFSALLPRLAVPGHATLIYQCEIYFGVRAGRREEVQDALFQILPQITVDLSRLKHRFPIISTVDLAFLYWACNGDLETMETFYRLYFDSCDKNVTAKRKEWTLLAASLARHGTPTARTGSLVQQLISKASSSDTVLERWEVAGDLLLAERVASLGESETATILLNFLGDTKARERFVKKWRGLLPLIIYAQRLRSSTVLFETLGAFVKGLLESTFPAARYQMNPTHISRALQNSLQRELWEKCFPPAGTPHGTLEETDNPADLFFIGHDFGNCLSYDKDPIYSRCLLNILLDGKIKMIVAIDFLGNFLAAAPLTLLYDDHLEKGVLFLDEAHGITEEERRLFEEPILEYARRRALFLGMELTASPKYGRVGFTPYTHSLLSLGGATFFEFVDVLGNRMDEDGNHRNLSNYEIPSEKLFWVTAGIEKSCLAPRSALKKGNWLKKIDNAVPRSYWFNAAVIISVGAAYYFGGFMPEKMVLNWSSWVEIVWKTASTFVFFAILADVLAKRTNRQKISCHSVGRTAASGLINGLLTILFFTAIQYAPIWVALIGVAFRFFILRKSLKFTAGTSLGLTALYFMDFGLSSVFSVNFGLLRSALVAFDLVYLRNEVTTRLFYVDEKNQVPEQLKAKHNRKFESYWMARPYSTLIKNPVLQTLPFEMRGPLEAILNYLFQLYYSWGLHETHRASLVGDPKWVARMQRNLGMGDKPEDRGWALYLYSLRSIPLSIRLFSNEKSVETSL